MGGKFSVKFKIRGVLHSQSDHGKSFVNLSNLFDLTVRIKANRQNVSLKNEGG